MLLSNNLITDGNSDNQSAFPDKNTGFFKELFKILITLSAIEIPLSVFHE